MTGYFRVSKTLGFEKISYPFKTLDDTNLDPSRGYLCENEPPVKVSIPKGTVDNSKKKYAFRNRSTYDPADSVFIGDFLHQGFCPCLWSGLAIRQPSQSVSLEYDCVLHLRKNGNQTIKDHFI